MSPKRADRPAKVPRIPGIDAPAPIPVHAPELPVVMPEPRVIAPAPAPVSDPPPLAPKPVSKPATPARLPTAPQGAIQTLNPKGQGFGIAWSAINQYDALIAAATAEFRVPFARLKALIPIESGGVKTAVQKNNQNGWSYGVTQVVPFGVGWAGHHAKVRQLAGLSGNASNETVVNALYDPLTNLRVAAAILRGYFDDHGTWDAANSAFFTGKPGWQGADSVNGTRGGDYQRALNGLLAEIWAADAETGAGEGEGTPAPSPSPRPAPALNFGPHPLPTGFTVKIATKRAGTSGQGWSYTTSKRGPRLLVTFWHHTAGGKGFGKDECHALFSIGGEREYQALTEAVIDRDGTGYIMNDPWSADLLDGSGRIPFASGPYAKSGGALAPFVQRYGANAINELGWATEHCHGAGEAWGDKLLDGSARLHGWVITKMQIPWDQWPKNPRMSGIWASYDHDDAANTTCPNMPAGVRQALMEAVRLEAKRLQVGGVISPPGPLPEPEPARWPFSFTQAEVAAFWSAEGGLVRHAGDGSSETYAFDPQGPIASMWLARAAKQGVFPAALDWWQHGNGYNFVTFGSANDADWVLALPDLNGRGDWFWADSPREAL